jgi:Recombinase
VVAVMPWERTGSKIAARHRERLAVVYVRQSTRQQVVGHQESTRLQYALVERAVALGWEASRVVLIDDDLGKSGRVRSIELAFSVWSQRSRWACRPGAGRRDVASGTLGEGLVPAAGAVRAGGSLLAGADGVDDPTEYNDRLLLGPGGNDVRGGVVPDQPAHAGRPRQQGPAGRAGHCAAGRLLAAPLGEAVVDPDEQVQGVVRLVFAKFAELGSVQGVVRFLVEHGIQLGVRARSGPNKGEIVWKRPARSTITGMINSPIYAGVYVYGRRLTDRTGCVQQTGVGVAAADRTP